MVMVMVLTNDGLVLVIYSSEENKNLRFFLLFLLAAVHCLISAFDFRFLETFNFAHLLDSVGERCLQRGTLFSCLLCLSI